MPVDVRVRYSGPMFDNTGMRLLRDTNDDIEDDVVELAERLINARLPQVLRNPTGRFQSTIHIVHTADPYVDGEGTIYGRWLEGEGSRNRTTRFKGYHTFRIVAQMTDHAAGPVAEREIAHMARRLN